MLVVILIVLAFAFLVAILVIIMQLLQDTGTTTKSPMSPVMRKVTLPSGKSVKINTRVLKEFLNKADDAYMEAYQRANVEYFLPFCIVPLAMYLNNQIIYNNDKVFGLKNQRTREWLIVSVTDKTIVMHKRVTFKYMKKSPIRVADAINEVWTVGFNPSRFVILEVQDYEG